MKTILSLFISIICCNAMAQSGSVVVEIKGIKNTQGSIAIGLYNQAKGFAEYGKRYKGVYVKASKTGVKYSFKDIPVGTYAIAVFHDENNNKEVDKNWFGVPTESYGFSQNKYSSFGSPDFEEVSFVISSNQSKSLTIKLK